MTTTEPIRYIRRKTLLERVPYTDRHILNLEKKGQFPKRRVLSARCVAWVEAEVEAWLKSRQIGSLTPPCTHQS
ncbi:MULTISPECIES: helix-turn-helix transcriptional regulator [Giesbergeria]|uniref:Helix-turn-helix transcriptional regulator n=1 Tax=Giesbergeria sinuosa TaxID=80883 RepID=A0ABV9QBF3_9BURK